MKTVRYWSRLYFNDLIVKCLILKDQDNHYSVIYQANGSIAHQFQKGFSPIVYPTPKYRVVEFIDRWDIHRLRDYNIS